MGVDPNVQAIADLLENRAKTGLKKYGVTTERDDLNFAEWIRHTQEELLDAAVYLERVRQDADKLEAYEQALEAAQTQCKGVARRPVFEQGWWSCADFIKADVERRVKEKGDG